MTTSLGFVLSPKYGLERAAKADLVGVPASAAELGVGEAVRDLLRETVDREVWVLSLCSGAFTLAAAGLLGDRRVR